MADAKQHAWRQQPGESLKAFQAFVVYCNLDPRERSLRRVGQELGKSRVLIERWSSRWGWVERVGEWEAYQEMRRLEVRIAERKRTDEEHLKIVRATRTKAIKALKEADPKQLAKNPKELRNWLTELIRLERLIMGEPESIEGRREKVEIHASIEERLKDYVPVFQELIDEGAIRLEGQETTDLLATTTGDQERGEEDEDGPPVFEY